MRKQMPFVNNPKGMAPLVAELVDKEANRRVEEIKKLFGETAIRTITAASMVALHDKFGFGQERLNRYQQAVEEHLVCINWGIITLEDLEETCNRLQEKAKLNLDADTGYIEYRKKVGK